MIRKLTSAIAVVAMTLLTVSSTNLNLEPDKQVSTAPTVSESEQVYQESLALLKQAADKASKKVTPVRKGVAATFEVSNEYDNLISLISQYRQGQPLNSYNHSSSSLFSELRTQNLSMTTSDMRIITSEAVTSLEERVDIWTTLVDDINQQAAPVGETTEQRITRLQLAINQPFPFKVESCVNHDGMELAWGCYEPGDDFYTLTPELLEFDDCYVKTTLAHEYRHYQQWTEGLMDGPNLKQNNWLEDDARAHEWLGGGC